MMEEIKIERENMMENNTLERENMKEEIRMEIMKEIEAKDWIHKNMEAQIIPCMDNEEIRRLICEMGELMRDRSSPSQEILITSNANEEELSSRSEDETQENE